MSDRGSGHDRFMRLAIETGRRGGASGNIAVGSVVVRDDVVIGRGCNTATSDGDPTNHAEIVAIRDACRETGARDLPRSTLYTSMEPCPMCACA